MSDRRTGSSRFRPTSATVEIGTITAAEGYEVLQGNELAGIDTELAALVIPAADDRFIRAEGLSLAVELQPTLEYDSAERHVHERRDRHGLHGQRRGLVRLARGRGARARLADARRLPELLDRPHEPALPRPVRAGVRLDVRLRGDLRVPDVRARAVPRDRAEQADAEAAADPAGAARSPLRDPGLPLRARLEGVAERRVRGDQPDARAGHPLALRPDVGAGCPASS